MCDWAAAASNKWLRLFAGSLPRSPGTGRGQEMEQGGEGKMWGRDQDREGED